MDMLSIEDTSIRRPHGRRRTAWIDQIAAGCASLGNCPSSEEKLAWVHFYRAHTKLIRAVLKRRGVHEGDIDDLEQQVWIALLKRWASLRMTSRPTPSANTSE